MSDLEIKVEPGDYNRYFDFLVTDGMSVGASITMKPFKTHEDVDPTFVLTRSAAIRLMDALWAIGLRPSKQLNEPDKKEHCQAVRLEEMRQLVFRMIDAMGGKK